MSENRPDYFIPAVLRDGPEILDQDMTPGDIIAALERLKFNGGLCILKLDSAVRDYLVDALRRSR
jgi:hypothetical protein